MMCTPAKKVTRASRANNVLGVCYKTTKDPRLVYSYSCLAYLSFTTILRCISFDDTSRFVYPVRASNSRECFVIPEKLRECLLKPLFLFNRSTKLDYLIKQFLRWIIFLFLVAFR